MIDSTTIAAAARAVAENAAPPPLPQAKPAQVTPKPAAKAPPQKEISPTPAPPPAAPASNPEPGPVAPAPPPAVPATPVAPPPPPPPQPVTITIPEGAIVTVRTIDSIDSQSATTGQYFKASLDNAVVVSDHVVLPLERQIETRPGPFRREIQRYQ